MITEVLGNVQDVWVVCLGREGGRGDSRGEGDKRDKEMPGPAAGVMGGV